MRRWNRWTAEGCRSGGRRRMHNPFDLGDLSVFTRNQRGADADGVGLKHGCMKTPDAVDGEIEQTIGGAADRERFAVDEGELNAHPIEIFLGIISDGADHIAKAQRMFGPADVGGLQKEFLLGIRRLAPWNEDHRLHAAILAIDQFVRLGDFVSKSSAAKVALALLIF